MDAQMWRNRTLSIRDLTTQDLDQVVRYWTEASETYLNDMGIDRSRLGDADEIHARLVSTIPSGDRSQRRQAFAIDLGGDLIGYTNVNCHAPDRNFSHWHIIRPDLRGSGISTALYPARLKTYFTRTEMELLTHQTRVSNIGVNRVLDRFVPISETRYVAEPDGLARPGEFHLRYMSRANAEGIIALAKSECLGRPSIKLMCFAV